jgi:hypothetical protein
MTTWRCDHVVRVLDVDLESFFSEQSVVIVMEHVRDLLTKKLAARYAA